MANPARALWDYLRGKDLQAPVVNQPPFNTVLQKKAAPFGPPGYSSLSGFSFTPASYAPTSSMSATDVIRLGMLISGPGSGDLYRSALTTSIANSAVFACLQAIALAFPQAPARMYKGNPDSPDAVPAPDHPLEDILDAPNPDISAPELWYGVQYAKHTDGNAYWAKVRSDAGTVVEVWPIPPYEMVPYTSPEDAADSRRRYRITNYRHYIKPSVYVTYPKEDIIHFRMGSDPCDPRVGLGPVKQVLREIAGDDEANNFTRELLQNGAVPGLVAHIPPEQSRNFTEEKASELKARIETAFRSGNRGRVSVLTAGADLKQYGFDPNQMSLRNVVQFFEERISAVLRVPPIIAGLGAGIANSSYSNFREARQAFMDTSLVPLYTFDAATLNRQLLPEFSPQRNYFVKFDTSQIQALKEDENQLWARLDNAFKSGWAAASEVRVRAGLPQDMPDDGIPAQQPPTPITVLRPTEDARRGGSSNIVRSSADGTLNETAQAN